MEGIDLLQLVQLSASSVLTVVLLLVLRELKEQNIWTRELIMMLVNREQRAEEIADRAEDQRRAIANAVGAELERRKTSEMNKGVKNV
jgi:hypothetical protein